QVEANLLGVISLPPQDEDLKDLTNTKHEVYVSYEKSSPTGAIFIEQKNSLVWIHKLVVDPNHFRKGIAKSLVSYALNLYPDFIFNVSTGDKNQPALNLYKKFHFELKSRSELAEGLSVVTLERKP
ncbi:MAG: GNAT family N-acetyltransferase, partial [Bdellovibrionales bacterium]|nr:GNAT family N-acetyltransferase [Bdellovibrionales bacterium]